MVIKLTWRRKAGAGPGPANGRVFRGEIMLSYSILMGNLASLSASIVGIEGSYL
jgi:hypothetical protein